MCVMNNGRVVVPIVAAAVLLAGTGVASAEHMRAMPGDGRTTIATPPNSPDRVVPPLPDTGRGGDEARVVGRVLKLDRERGLIALDTERGVLVLQGPPEALRSVEIGDVVSLVLNADDETPAASPAEPEGSKK
jgi:hypothetical protein